MIFPEAAKTAAEVRDELGLLVMKSDENLRRLEAAFRSAMSPDMPSYDVFAIQGADFDEWSYMQAMGCFIAQTQSVEINVRLLMEALEYPADADHAESILHHIQDKWDLEPLPLDVSARGFHVAFPPGGNVSWIVDRDHLRRMFWEDRLWTLKPHPITTQEDQLNLKRMFGATRLYDPGVSGMALLKEADVVGYTTASEMGLLAMLLGKPTVNFSAFKYEEIGTVYALYRAVWAAGDARAAINSILSCPWSGVMPLATDDAEAMTRFTMFRAKTEELREIYRPLTRPIPETPNVS